MSFSESPRRVARLRTVPMGYGLALMALVAANEAFAVPLNFASTSDAASWLVATSVSGIDNGVFPTSGFVTATAINGRVTDGVNWIANNSSGSNGGIGQWTQFVFRQNFDLSGFDPASIELEFRWAADDSGEGFASRGSWVPKFSLNGGALVPWGSGPTYDFGGIVDLTSGFVAGLNHLDFYVQGNGQTDGFALESFGFTVTPVPEPTALCLLGAALGGLRLTRRRA